VNLDQNSLALAQLVVLVIECAAIIAGAAIALRSFRADHERRKKQATIEFTHNVLELRSSVWSQVTSVFGSDVINPTDPRYKDDVKLQANVTQYLKLMERLAVGINVGVYDLYVFTRITGRATSNTYKRLFPVIEEKRKSAQAPTLYIEFERLVRSIDEEMSRMYPTPTGKDMALIRCS